MIPKAAEAHYKAEQRVAVAASRAIQSLWSRMGPDFDASWAGLQAPIVGVLTAAQLAAATEGSRYVSKVLAETRQVDLPVGDVVPAAFAGVAASGLALEEVTYNSVLRTKHRIKEGDTVANALKAGGSYLSMVALSEIADAGRNAAAAGMSARPSVAGYVRMLNTPSCPRCVILAGKWFRWNAGFQRHPGCDCRHIPSAENIAGDFTTDPYEYFKNISTEDQNKLFRPHGVSRERAADIGRSNARAIRDGADIYRVENIRLRGLGTAKSNARYGTPSKFTVDDIYAQAGTRTRAIAWMRDEGYITGAQVGGGNLIGMREGFGALGRGGTRKGATAAVTEARLTGVRDPLNRYTMTAAERRLYDADLMMQTIRSGRNPWLKRQPLTSADRELADQIMSRQLNDLVNQPASVNELARKLGLIL